MILLVHSCRDIAGVNIAANLLQSYPFVKTEHAYQENVVYEANIGMKQVSFITLKDEAVSAQYLQDDFPNAKLIVFISRHSSQSGIPTLSVHTPGNLAEAQLGGLPRTVSVSPAYAMRDVLKSFLRYKEAFNLNYEVTYECTHHGPSLDVPTMFVELGSSLVQWNDLKAAEAVAHSAMSAVANFTTTPNTAVLGIGGPHYNQKFTQMALAGEAVFGHMIPKHAVPNIDSEMLTQCIQRTFEKVSSAVLDWKGIKSQDKPELLSALQEANLSYKKV